MATDVTSPLLQLLLQGTGNNNNSWGQNLNDQCFTLLEQAIAGTTSISVTGAGDVTLTADQSRSATIIVSGTLTADQTIIVPATRKKWSFINGCSGTFFVLVKTASGTARNLPAGKFVDVVSDGSGALYRKDGHQVGEFFYHAGTSAPAGAIECNGAFVKRLSAIDLFAAVGTTWGIGDNVTTFQLPDGYTAGRFIRSRSAAVAVGVYQGNQNKAHTHTGGGTTTTESVDHTHFGSGQTGGMDASNPHFHDVAGGGGYLGLAIPGGSNSFSPGGSVAVVGITINATDINHGHSYSLNTGGRSAAHTHSYSFTTSGGSADGAEARPESMVGILCIRY